MLVFIILFLDNLLEIGRGNGCGIIKVVRVDQKNRPKSYTFQSLYIYLKELN
jgi:hypothetical protein